LKIGRSSDSGFTLVEVLLVVFILGLSASVVVMNLPERQSAFEEDAARLQRDVYALGDRAVLTGLPHAIEFGLGEYKSVLWQGDGWVPLTGFERTLSEEASIVFPDVRQRESDALSRIVFDPTGVPSQARVGLSGRGQQVDIRLSRNLLDQER